jgi:23S rRNA pseudouridine1911/1915/1917 synthase
MQPRFPFDFKSTACTINDEGVSMDQDNLIIAGSTYSITVDKDAAAVRLDQFITRQFPTYSRTFFKRLIDESCVTINGTLVCRPGVTLKLNDQVAIRFPEARQVTAVTLQEVASQVRVVHEHPHFLILHKPAGLVVHAPSTRSTITTLVDWLINHYNEVARVGCIDRPGIVHRLDKDTSGLIIIPRTNYAHALFTTMFKDRTIQKTYHAVVAGHPPKKGTINFAIGRDAFSKTKMVAADLDNPFGGRASGTLRAATTHYEVITYFDTYSLVRVKPVTGRTHQIRVHFQALGHSLLGDPTYGESSPLIARHALHAHQLDFTFDGQSFSFVDEYPIDFAKLVSNQ